MYKFDVHQLTCIHYIMVCEGNVNHCDSTSLVQPAACVTVLLTRAVAFLFCCKWNYFCSVCEVCPPLNTLLELLWWRMLISVSDADWFMHRPASCNWLFYYFIAIFLKEYNFRVKTNRNIFSRQNELNQMTRRKEKIISWCGLKARRHTAQ